VKLYDQGQVNETSSSCFVPTFACRTWTVGDVRAQVAACHTGERAIIELIERYDLETFRAVTTDLINYTERLMRDEIASWPDGQYSFTDYMDSDGCGGPPVKLHVSITVAGDSLTADFTGSATQTGCLELHGGIRHCRGRPLRCDRSCRRPCPTTPGSSGLERDRAGGYRRERGHAGCASMRGVTGFRLLDAVFGALASSCRNESLARVKAATRWW